MTGHTLKSLEVREFTTSIGVCNPDIKDNYKSRIAEVVYWGKEGRPEALAYGHLFAAAPETAAERGRLREDNADLLAALINYHDYFQNFPDHMLRGERLPYEEELQSKASAAIAKAGETA